MARKPSIGLEIYFSEDIEMHLGWKLLLIAGILLVLAELFHCNVLYVFSILFSAVALFPKR